MKSFRDENLFLDFVHVFLYRLDWDCTLSFLLVDFLATKATLESALYIQQFMER